MNYLVKYYRKNDHLFDLIDTYTIHLNSVFEVLSTINISSFSIRSIAACVHAIVETLLDLHYCSNYKVDW